MAPKSKSHQERNPPESKGPQEVTDATNCGPGHLHHRQLARQVKNHGASQNGDGSGAHEDPVRRHNAAHIFTTRKQAQNNQGGQCQVQHDANAPERHGGITEQTSRVSVRSERGCRH